MKNIFIFIKMLIHVYLMLGINKITPATCQILVTE